MYVESVILRLIALGIDVIFIMHEDDAKERDAGSTSKKPAFTYTGKIAPYPARYKHILSHFNEVWRMTLVSGDDGSFTPKVNTRPDYTFNASTCMLLDSIEEPNICDMIEKHLQRECEKERGAQTC